MKLVASASSAGKLPAAETCSLDEDEDDDDDDDDGQRTGESPPRVRFFHKYKMSSAAAANDNGAKDDDEMFENIRMSSKSLLTSTLSQSLCAYGMSVSALLYTIRPSSSVATYDGRRTCTEGLPSAFPQT